MLPTVADSPVEPGSSQARCVAPCSEAEVLHSGFGRVAAAVELSNCRANGELRTASGRKCLFGAAPPNETVEALVCVLGLPRKAP
jgi:hypothetical protein